MNRTLNRSRWFLGAAAAVLLVSLGSPAARAADEWWRGWALEDSIARAQLVLVARVVGVSQLRVVEGAKTNTIIREYRFQPVRRLKGVFGRDELPMTSSDLGCPPEDGSLPPPFREGEHRLLILAQQGGNFVGCVSAASGSAPLEQQVPLLSGPDDPIVAAADALVRALDARSRRERTEIILDQLEQSPGPAAVPLLDGLRRRAVWAARFPAAAAILGRLAADASPAIRDAAIGAIEAVIASDHQRDQPQMLEAFAAAARGLLDSDRVDTAARVSALQALGRLGEPGRRLGWPAEILMRHLRDGRTYAERLAAAEALGELRDPSSADAVLEELRRLPLDENPGREAVVACAAIRLDRERAAAALGERLERSMAAGQSLLAEVRAIGCLRDAGGLPRLLEAARAARTAPSDRLAIARAFELLRSDEAAPVLAGWLRGAAWDLRAQALAALEAIGTAAAAEAARPWFRSEPFLPYKLRLAGLLGRNGVPDGYSLAIEHLADAEHTVTAAAALGAIRDPRAEGELTAVLEGSRDSRWRAAALAGLTALGHAASRRQLLEILADERHPLAAEAAAAAGLAADPEVLLPLAALAGSRNHRIALESLRAIRAVLERLGAVGPEPPGECECSDVGADRRAPAGEPTGEQKAVAAALRAILLDGYTPEDQRLEALGILRWLRGEGYGEALKRLADQAELEGSALLPRVEGELRRAGIRLDGPRRGGRRAAVRAGE